MRIKLAITDYLLVEQLNSEQLNKVIQVVITKSSFVNLIGLRDGGSSPPT